MAKQRVNLTMSPDAIAALSDLAEANSTTLSGLLERLAALLAVRNHASDLNLSPKPYHRKPRVKRSGPDRTLSAECGAECGDR